MPGTGYQPLEIISADNQQEPTEAEKFRQAATEGSLVDEVICLTALDTGMRAGEISHMVEDWLNWRHDTLEIDVQQYEKCRLGSSNHDTTKRDEPCWYCRTRAHKNFLPPKNKLPDDGDCWHPKSEAGYKGRQIPIPDSHTADILSTYFRVYDAIGSAQQVRGAIRRTAKRAGIHETEVVVDKNGKKKSYTGRQRTISGIHTERSLQRWISLVMKLGVRWGMHSSIRLTIMSS